jgi:SAM-dependent methyltransferase
MRSSRSASPSPPTTDASSRARGTTDAEHVSFDRLAPDYDTLRPVDEGWWTLFNAVVDAGDLAGRSVLEVGTGPGRLAAALHERGCRVWAIDASAEMLEQARANVPAQVGLKQARAEALPFKDAWFERAVMRMTVHLLDRPRAFAELHRVLAPVGRLVIATHDPATFEDGWLARFFPSVPVIDGRRFPTERQLLDELAAAGFEPGVERLQLPVELPRDHALAKLRGQAFSTFDLLPPGEYEAGLARAERELPETLRYAHHWLLAVGTC